MRKSLVFIIVVLFAFILSSCGGTGTLNVVILSADVIEEPPENWGDNVQFSAEEILQPLEEQFSEDVFFFKVSLNSLLGNNHTRNIDIESVSAENFSVYENDTVKKGFHMKKTSAARKGYEIIFVIDTTGSMGNALLSVKESILSFTEVIKNDWTIDNVKIGVVAFDDSVPAEEQNYSTSEGNFLSPTSNMNEVETFLEQLAPYGGGDGPENPFAGLMYANKLFSDDAQIDKNLILITDAFGHDSYDAGGAKNSELYYKADVQLALKGKATVHTIWIGNDSEDYSRLGDPREISHDGTGKLIFSENGQFDLTEVGIVDNLMASWIFAVRDNSETTMNTYKIFFKQNEHEGFCTFERNVQLNSLKSLLSKANNERSDSLQLYSYNLEMLTILNADFDNWRYTAAPKSSDNKQYLLYDKGYGLMINPGGTSGEWTGNTTSVYDCNGVQANEQILQLESSNTDYTGQCAYTCAKMSPSVPYLFASGWKKGENVLECNNIQPGTIIANFGTNDFYDGEEGREHAAIFISKGVTQDSKNYIYVWHSNYDWKKLFGKSLLLDENENDPNYKPILDASEFYIVEFPDS